MHPSVLGLVFPTCCKMFSRVVKRAVSHRQFYSRRGPLWETAQTARFQTRWIRCDCVAEIEMPLQRKADRMEIGCGGFGLPQSSDISEHFILDAFHCTRPFVGRLIFHVMACSGNFAQGRKLWRVARWYPICYVCRASHRPQCGTQSKIEMRFIDSAEALSLMANRSESFSFFAVNYNETASVNLKFSSDLHMYMNSNRVLDERNVSESNAVQHQIGDCTS